MNDANENTEEPISAAWPEIVFAAFFRAVSQRDLWAWLREDEQFGLRQEIARGFQQSPRALTQPLVRSRLKAHLEKEATTRDALAQWWRENAGKNVVEVLALIENEEAFQVQNSQLIEQFGFDHLLLTVYFDGRFSIPEENETKTDNRVLETPREAPKTPSDESAQLQKQSEEWRQRAQAAEQSGIQLRRENDALRNELQRAQREREQQTHQSAKRDSEAQNKLSEAQKNFEREARRARGYEKEIEEQSLEIKRLKRLVRQGQLLQEETRRHLAQLQAQIEEQNQVEEPTPTIMPEVPVVAAKPAKPKKPPRPPKPLFGRDEVFVWKSEQREVRVSPREAKERIDKNDEIWVAALSRDIETLRDNNEELAKRFLSGVREVGRYYVRVLHGATTRVLVDASNVARYEKDSRGRGQFQHLITMREELRRYDCFPILFYADASLPHNIDEPDELKEMARRGELEIVIAGTEADDILAREARGSGASVVTNDRNFHRRVAPNWEPSRISFHIRDGIVVLEGMD